MRGLRLLLFIAAIHFFFIPPLFSVSLETDPEVFEGREKLNDYISVFYDSEQTASIDTIEKIKEDGKFSLPGESRINQGHLPYPVWIEFSLKNSSTEVRDLLLSFDDPGIDEILFYNPDGNEGFQETRIVEGSLLHRNFRYNRKPVINIKIKPGDENTYYARIASHRQGLLLSLTVSEIEAFVVFENRVSIASGVLFGAALFFIIYLITFSIKLNEEAEIWFSVNLFSICWYYAVRFGFTQTLFPGAGPEFYNIFRYIMFALSCLSGIKILRLYLEIWLMSPVLDRIFRVIQWCPFLYLILTFVNRETATVVGALTYTGIPGLTVYSIIRKFHRSSMKERLFILTWSAYLLLYSLGLIISLGIIPWNDMMFGLIPVTIAWALITFPYSILSKYHQYKNQSFIDGLTGLWNRRYFNFRLKAGWSFCRRAGTPISMLMIDVDHFKLFNDKHGHLLGDECLKDITWIIKNVIRRVSDDVFRYGGEEFAVLLPGTEEEGALQVAESVLSEVRKNSPRRNDIYGPGVTVSIGIATILPGETEKPEELIHSSDMALYEAKSRGRNRLWVFSMENSETYMEEFSLRPDADPVI